MIRKLALFAASLAILVVGLASLAVGVSPGSGGAAADERAEGHWGCAGVHPVFGVCLDSPIETLDLELL